MAAWAYSAATCLAALAVAGVAVWQGTGPAPADWKQFAVLTPLAMIAPLLSVSVGRNHSFDSGATFVVAAAIVLPPSLLVALVVLSYLPQWLKARYAWYMQAFNISNTALSSLAAFAVTASIGSDRDLTMAAGGIAAAAVFTGANHGLLAAMLKVGRGHSFRSTGLFSTTGLGTDFVLAGLGVAVAAFVEWNPWLVPTLIAPLLLAHRSLSVVALLRESEERFRTMFESAATTTLLIDLDGTILMANRAAKELFGHDLEGRSHRELIHPDEGEPTDFARLTRGEREHYRAERRLVNAAGETVFGQVAVSLVRDADTQPQFALAMIDDVTERHELEERLRQSQKLEAIGRLAGGVAHDFNNMLTAIGGYNALALEHTPEASPVHADLQEVRKATERATLLTRQLLAFSRKQILQPELLNLNAVVVDLESMLRPLIGEDIVLTTALDPALGPIEADPSQLQQVVMNLVVNARDAMPAGGTLSIETANVEIGPDDDASIEPGRYVTLTVRDGGEGIDAATLEQIFEPFFTTKETGKGTGLGLATVYGIVKQSGGYLVVESEVGEGSAFTIYLPRDHDARATPRPDPVHVPAPAAAAEPVPAGETVLLVEDEEVVRRLVRQVLEGGGYRVLEAADGLQAVELAAGNRVDLLLTDMVMPGLGGREVAEELRRTAPGLKVIFMSGYAESGLSDNGTLQPGTELLEKPFAFGDLLAQVRRVLDGG